MARLNLKFYDGNDYYSDGDIENVIMNFVLRESKFEDIPSGAEMFPVLYHLSPERENILNWYPFDVNSRILEIGAGCGAITGLLCRSGASVTCIELSKKRSEINYARNKLYDNLEIIVGNFNDIKLDEKYDYVILNGVFEYAMSFTRQKDPYVYFLKHIISFLNSKGKILLAIENRLGIKYFSGATEDHTNTYFTGINEYRENNTVRTFSKAELENVFRKCGLKKWKFYYPYPDYKFPIEIFTDENVNGANFGRPYRNYQQNRVILFDELSMIGTLKKEKVMSSFTNSFLIEICVNDSEVSNVLYAKMNNTRRKEFRIATVEFRECGECVFRKIPLNPLAIKHIKRIYENQKESFPILFQNLHGVLKNDFIEYPCLYESSLDAYIDQLIENEEIKKVIAIFDHIYDALIRIATVRSRKDIYVDEFRECFGNAELNKGEMLCITRANIDLILDNLFIRDNKLIIIDPEWVFDFEIPISFIIWRMLNEWYSKKPNLRFVISQELLYSKYNIDLTDVEVYREWAMYFADCYVTGMKLDKYVSLVKPIDINELIQEANRKNCVESSLYINYGEGFSEKDKYVIEMNVEDGNFSFSVMLDENKKVKGIRWDPIENHICRCEIEVCLLDKKSVDLFPVNAEKNDASLFLTLDPQILLGISEGYYKELEIRGKFSSMDELAFLDIVQKDRQFQMVIETENDVLKEEHRLLLSNCNMLEKRERDLLTETKELDNKIQMLSEELRLIKESKEYKFLQKLKSTKERLSNGS